MRVIGLTGGIGMGKSTAAGAFRRAGIAVFDADAAVRRLQGPGGRALAAIEAHFPGTVRDGMLDRAALRAQVLADPPRMRTLESIMHPLVRAEQRRFLARARGAGRRLVVLDIPLLLEGGRRRDVDLVVVVSAPPPIQMQRCCGAAECLAPRCRPWCVANAGAQKRAQADVVIRTGLSRFHATAAIRRLIARERQR